MDENIVFAELDKQICPMVFPAMRKFCKADRVTYSLDDALYHSPDIRVGYLSKFSVASIREIDFNY